MSEVLSLSEIQEQFPGEWVLLEGPHITDSLEIRGGKVLWHSKDRDEVYRNSAILYTGKLPEEAAVVL